MKAKAKAELLRSLHAGPDVLVLPNAWDVASARVFEEAGFAAIATSSAGIAASLGYPDGEKISRGEMAKAIGRIAAAVRVPVSADLEAGYGPIIKAVRQTVEAALEAGAVGMNLEDGTTDRVRPLRDVDDQCERIRAARGVSAELVINARTDVYVKAHLAERSRFAEAVKRGNAYLKAGADCVFVPSVTDRETIRQLAKAIGGPLNVLAGAGTPPVAELRELGVRRVSLGSGAMRAALGLTRKIAKELRESGTYEALTRDAIPYAEVNELLK
ncbi:MAG TPA: isocitrate lyase/phosphoenolpyruvate mutase family protein [Planctomycetota bacterium]